MPPAPLRKGLGARDQLSFEGFCESLKAKVVVPLIGELLVLFVQMAESNVLSTRKGPAPLL